MGFTSINGIIYTASSEDECFVGTDDNSKNSNAIDGEISSYLRFEEIVSIDNKPHLVTAIGGSAFRGCGLFRTVRIHRYIKRIKYRAFDLCSGCNKIIFDKESNLEAIEESGFYFNRFSYLVLPKSIKEFGFACFGGNQNLKSITYFGVTNPSSTIDVFYSGPKSLNIYVGFDYPYETFHSIQVTKISNIKDRVCTNNRTRKTNNFIFVFMIILVS